MNDRFENINLLRAFAATAVVVYHVIELMAWKAFPVTGPLLTFRVGWIGVDLFFVISGFVITRSAIALWQRDAAAFGRNYWARRISRIVPLYVLTGLLWIVFYWPGFLSDKPLRIAWQLGSHLTFTHSFWPITFDSIDGVNWTLALEMQFYLCVALLVPWIARTPGWRIWLGCVLIAWAWRAAMFYASGPIETHHLFMRTMQLPGALDEFGAGIFLARWADRRTAPRPMDGGLWALAAVAAGTICFSIYWPHAGYWNLPGMVIFWRTSLGLFFLCVVAAAVYLPSFAQAWPLRPLWYLGVVSYGIYLWHLFAIKICQAIPGLEPLQQLGLTLGLTVLFAAVSWHLFEKPILDFGRRFHGRSTAELRPLGARGP
jgi:peptidoglycan/LPS O-acetylase OafA/YrhL